MHCVQEICCQWKSAAPKLQKALLPQNASQLAQIRPSEALQFADPREAYYFRGFQEETARELSGFRKSTAWTHAMLQSCHSEPFVLRGLVAIRALDKSIKLSHAASVEPQLRDINQNIANQHR